MKLNKLIVIFIFILLFSSISIVFADDWSLSEEVGTWDNKSRTYWKSGDNWEGEARLDFDHNAEQGLTLWDLRVNAHVESGLGLIHHGIEFGIYNINTSYIVWSVVILYWRETAGALSLTGMNIQVPKLSNYSEYEAIYDASNFYTVRILIYRSADTTLTLKIAVFSQQNDTDAIWNFRRDYTFSNETLNNAWIYQMIGVFRSYSKGYAEGQIWNEKIICTGEIISEDMSIEGTVDFWEKLKRSIWNSLTNVFTPISNYFRQAGEFLGNLYDYLSFGAQFIISLFGTVTKFLPLFFCGYLFYILGLLIVCIVQWNPDPLFEHLTAIYNFFANLIDMIVSIAQTIWDYIKVW